MLWGELDRETQLFGLAAPGGEVSVTGIGGLTLGGGMGLAVRRFGLSCDSLRSIQVVTADGSVRTASRQEHPDLFWAARGSGRGIGVVTSFEFDLHPLGPEVAVAQVLYRYEEAEQVTRAWRAAALNAPDTVSPELALWSIPPDPAIPEELHGTRTVLVAGMYAGPPGDAAAALAPLRELGTPIADQSATLPYVVVQSSFDAIVPDGGRYYMKSHFMDEITDEAIRVLLDWDARRPNPEPLVVFRTLGGAVSRVGDDETAYAHRRARFNLSIDSFWFDPALDKQAIEWSRGTWDAMRPFSTGGVYLNFAGLEEDAVGRDALFGSNEERAARIRATYDPYGIFETAASRV